MRTYSRVMRRVLSQFWTAADYTSAFTMEGCYNVEENIDFDNFLKEMGVTDDATIQKMIQATKQVTKLRYFLNSNSIISPQVTLTANSDGTWTQVSGLKTSTFPINEEFKVYAPQALNTPH